MSKVKSNKIIPSSQNKTTLDLKDTLSTRQKNLLFAVIKEYCDSGQNIGSKEIKEKYSFDFSPATIRNEFSALRKMGYLYQPFTNASSQPTEKAFKLFINQLISGLQVTTKRQKELQIELERMQKKQKLLDKELSRLLSMQGGGVGFAINSQTETYSGIKNLIAQPSQGSVSDILDFLDNLDTYKQPLLENSKYLNNQIETISDSENETQKLITASNKVKKNHIKAYFGFENPVLPLGKGYAMIAADIYLNNKNKKEKSVIGLIAPTHLLAKKKNVELLEALSKSLNQDIEEE
jgi:transcriptional regulator of heat shock response